MHRPSALRRGRARSPPGHRHPSKACARCRRSRGLVVDRRGFGGTPRMCSPSDWSSIPCSSCSIGKWALAGWLLGGAAATQLLVIMVVPLFIGLIGWRKSAGVLTRAAVLPGFLFGCCHPGLPRRNVGARQSALRSNRQPRHPMDRPGPQLASRRPRSGRPGAALQCARRGGGGLRGSAVARGAVAHRVAGRRRSGSPLHLRSRDGAVLRDARGRRRCSLRCVTGSGSTSTMLCAAGLTVMVFTHHGRWEYFLAVAGLSVLMLALAWPGRRSPLTAGNACRAGSAGGACHVRPCCGRIA